MNCSVCSLGNFKFLVNSLYRIAMPAFCWVRKALRISGLAVTPLRALGPDFAFAAAAVFSWRSLPTSPRSFRTSGDGPFESCGGWLLTRASSFDRRTVSAVNCSACST